MSLLLTWANATVTICHSRTENIETIVNSISYHIIHYLDLCFISFLIMNFTLLS